MMHANGIRFAAIGGAIALAAVSLPAAAVVEDPEEPYSSGAVISTWNNPELNCNETYLPRNDDGSSSEVFLDFEINFYGDTYDSLWVNNNGNVTLDGPLGAYTPFNLSTTNRAIIAPFFADVDTRSPDGGSVFYNYGNGTNQGQRRG